LDFQKEAYLRPGRDGRFTASTTLPKENFRILFSSKGMAAASFSDFSTLDLQERLKDSVGDIQSEAGETEVRLKLQGHQRSLPKNGPARQICCFRRALQGALCPFARNSLLNFDFACLDLVFFVNTGPFGVQGALPISVPVASNARQEEHKVQAVWDHF
jgi:hypothetical protein